MRDGGVVLNLPEALGEAFPLVGFSELLFALVVWEQVLGPEGCPETPNAVKPSLCLLRVTI